MKMKKIASIVFAGCLSLMMTALPAKAAETVQYTVTIRPGSVARFSDTFLDQYRAIGATVTEKTGSIKVKVQAGGTIPYLPDAGDLVYQDGKEGRYTMNTDWYPDSLTVTENENLVVKYDALNDAVEYRVRYVDSQSGEDVATPMIAQGNVGDTYTYYSETISGYRCDTESQSLTLTSRAGDNELVFQYVSTVEPDVEQIVIPGDTITRTETIPGDTTIVTGGGTTTGGGTAAGTTGGATAGTGAGTGTTGTGTGAGVAADDGTGADTAGDTADQGQTETIDDNETPLGDQPQTDDQNNDTEEIEADETPKGSGRTENNDDTFAYVIAGGAVVLIAVAGLLIYARRHR